MTARELAHEVIKAKFGEVRCEDLDHLTSCEVATAAIERARRDTANTAGALLRDRAAELRREAERHARESDSPADLDEACITDYIASEVEKLSLAVYALGEPAKPEPRIEVDDDIAF